MRFIVLSLYPVELLGGPRYALHLLDMENKLCKAPIGLIEVLISQKADINFRDEVCMRVCFPVYFSVCPVAQKP